MVITLLICYREVLRRKSPELFTVVISEKVWIVSEKLTKYCVVQIIIGRIIREVALSAA